MTDLNHRQCPVSPARSTIDWDVLIPVWDAKIEAVCVTPVELLWESVMLQELCWLVIQKIVFLGSDWPYNALLPVSSM